MCLTFMKLKKGNKVNKNKTTRSGFLAKFPKFVFERIKGKIIIMNVAIIGMKSGFEHRLNKGQRVKD